MMYLFDTDSLSQLKKRTPSPKFLSKLARIPQEHQFTSSITIGEMSYGAHRSNQRDYILHQLRECVWPTVRVLTFDREVAEVYGKIRADLELAGKPLAVPDLRIAAIALTHEFVLITGNVRHFSRIPGLRIENWL